MAATKAMGTDDKAWKPGETRTYEEALNAPPEPATPTQAELDAMKLGEELEPAPEGETPEAKKHREEEARKKREAKAEADKQASYHTRHA